MKVHKFYLKCSSDRLVIVAKGFLKLPNLLMLIKTKESITSQKLRSRDFCRSAISVSDKCKSAIPHLFNGSEVLSSAFDRAKVFAENFLKRTLIFLTQVSLKLISLLELI